MRRAAPLVLLALAACVPNLTSPPENPPPPPAPPGQRIILTDDGQLVAETDPYASRPLRRADIDLQATTLAPGVSLVVEPAEGAPIYVSNLLAAALVRRFSGHMSVESAMAAPVVFLIRPVVSEEALTAEGRLVVDWLVRTEEGEPVGAVYAARRATGVVERGDPWTAASPDDVEHIALQTAANLLETPAVQEAVERGAVEAAIARAPSPSPRPERATPVDRLSGDPKRAPKDAPPPVVRPAR